MSARAVCSKALPQKCLREGGAICSHFSAALFFVLLLCTCDGVLQFCAAPFSKSVCHAIYPLPCVLARTFSVEEIVR